MPITYRGRLKLDWLMKAAAAKPPPASQAH
jgi:hypothetical protein